MKIWSISAGPLTVADWFFTAARRCLAHARRNDDLTADQRAALQTEGERFLAIAHELLAGGRAIEDFLRDVLGARRDDAGVLDFLCDAAQGEAWALLAIRQALLAEAGTTREAVLGAPLGTLKRASRPRTVEYARGTATRLKQLPPFAEQGPLVAKLEQRAGLYAETARLVDEAESHLETELRAPLAARLAALRVDVVRTRGRMLAALPAGLVDELFPRSAAGPRAETDGETTPADATP